MLSGWEILLRTLNVVGAALVVGGAVLIHFSVVPIFRDWPAELSWKLHKEFVIVNPDRYIKPSAAISLAAAIVALIVDDHPTSTLVLTIVGIASFAGVAVISEVINQPINRRFGRAEAVPGEYAELRVRWDRANLLRTSIAVVGLFCYVVAALEAA